MKGYRDPPDPSCAVRHDEGRAVPDGVQHLLQGTEATFDCARVHGCLPSRVARRTSISCSSTAFRCCSAAGTHAAACAMGRPASRRWRCWRRDRCVPCGPELACGQPTQRNRMLASRIKAFEAGEVMAEIQRLKELVRACVLAIGGCTWPTRKPRKARASVMSSVLGSGVGGSAAPTRSRAAAQRNGTEQCPSSSRPPRR